MCLSFLFCPSIDLLFWDFRVIRFFFVILVLLKKKKVVYFTYGTDQVVWHAFDTCFVKVICNEWLVKNNATPTLQPMYAYIITKSSVHNFILFYSSILYNRQKNKLFHSVSENMAANCCVFFFFSSLLIVYKSDYRYTSASKHNN